MKLIIAGGRDFKDKELMKSGIISMFYKYGIIKEDLILISGCCRGADKLGEQVLKEMGVEDKNILKFPAHWVLYGNSAGPIRNKTMAIKADVLLAFWDGKSKGTYNMIHLMKDLNKIVEVVRYE